MRNITSNCLALPEVDWPQSGSHVPSDASRPAISGLASAMSKKTQTYPESLCWVQTFCIKDAVQPGCTIAPPALGYSHFLHTRGSQNEAINLAIWSSRPVGIKTRSPDCVNDMSLRGRCVGHSRDQRQSAIQCGRANAIPPYSQSPSWSTPSIKFERLLFSTFGKRDQLGLQGFLDFE